MTEYLDISFSRAWRLTVVTSKTREQQVVDETELAAAINTVANEATIQHVQCEPVVTVTMQRVSASYNFAFYAEPPDNADAARQKAA